MQQQTKNASDKRGGKELECVENTYMEDTSNMTAQSNYGRLVFAH
jgi:hypothetical protein